MDNHARPEADPFSRSDPATSAGRVFEPSRLLGPLSAIGLVVVALAVASALIRWSGQPVPGWVDPADPTIEDGQQERLGGKVAALIREGWADRGRPGPGLGILIGSSTTYYGFDPAVLEAESPVPIRWLNLGTDGGNAEDTCRIARMVFRSGIRPDVVVLGLHQEMLPRTTKNCVRDPTAPRLDDLEHHLSEGNVRSAFGDVCGVTLAAIGRVFPRRSHTTYHVRQAAIEAKIRGFRLLGVSTDGLFAADADAWKSPPALKRKGGVADLEHPVISAKLFEAIDDCGWFTGENYRIENPGPQAVLRLMDECVRDNVRLVVVLTPKLGWLGRMEPARAFECLDEVLEGRAGRRPEVLDLRTAIPEPLFADLFHTDAAGRDIATRRLAAFLKAPSGDPSGGRGRRP